MTNLPFLLFLLFSTRSFTKSTPPPRLLLLSNENSFTFYEMKFVFRVKTSLVKTLELDYYNFISMKNGGKNTKSWSCEGKERPKVSVVLSPVCAPNSGPPDLSGAHGEHQSVL